MRFCSWAPSGSAINHLLLTSPSKRLPGWVLFKNAKRKGRGRLAPHPPGRTAVTENVSEGGQAVLGYGEGRWAGWG